MSQQYATYPSLRGKTVLITGGAEGIGAACVEHFWRQGSRVVFLDISESSAKKLLDKLRDAADAEADTTSTSERSPTPLPVFLHCDVTDLERLRACADLAATQHSDTGAVDVLINNAASAGASARLGTESVTSATWDAEVNVNLRHQFFLTQAVAPRMRDSGRGGSIVNMGSITWRIPAVGLPVYTLCKAAILGMTRTHSKEFGGWGVRVNSVVPGAIATQRQIDEVLTPEYRRLVMAAQTVQRDLRPDEVARLVLFLAAEDSSGITGSSYVVDGGWVSDL